MKAGGAWLGALACVAACQSAPGRHAEPTDAREARAEFVSAPGTQLRGTVELEETARGVEVEVEIAAGPTGTKGIHVHEKGDCSDIVGKSMGPHFSPDRHDHALPPTAERHLGDLGNIRIEASGRGKLELTIAGANLRRGDARSFLGRAVVIHAAADQGAGDPSGNSGTPIACAVITAHQN